MLHKFKKLSAILIILILLCVPMLGARQVSHAAAPSLSFVFLNKSSVSMKIGDEVLLKAVKNPLYSVTWLSSSPKIASVDRNGRVTAKKAGTAIITAKSNGAKATCTITVKKTTVKLNKTSVSMEHGGTATLKATLSNASKVTWTSSRKSVATVNQQGRVTGISPGQATITATTDNGIKAACNVTVRQPVIRLSDTKITLKPKKKYSILVFNSSTVHVTWKSSNEKVATVNQSGKVTAIKQGKAVITAQLDGTRKSCTVTVK